ncbi:hypothetical protein GDO86_000334 [Hymenochirus boettgeri]|uniref:Polyprenal reductase n=1 Tax=Hymenochirus boettgeri TaxID=247094 RepID=A0A8T2KE14_9PIPI|nr:hypothetical protein GDO86_000334 [Hymenochirus boettgeri]
MLSCRCLFNDLIRYGKTKTGLQRPYWLTHFDVPKSKIAHRNHTVPSGHWIEKVSCPHYFAELLIYTSIAIVFVFSSITWWLVVMYVIFNQALSAISCHEFYHDKFDSYPVHRKAFIPYIF